MTTETPDQDPRARRDRAKAAAQDAPSRLDRRKAALKANMARRKEQARLRAAGATPADEGGPDMPGADR